MSDTKHTPNIHSDYLHSALLPANASKAINKIHTLLKNYDFDAFAFRGMSGALIAPLLAFKCKKSLLMVRKPKHEEAGHSACRTEGDKAARRYIIIDDFICSGRTITAIVEQIAGLSPNAKCIGIVLYNDVIRYNSKVRIELASNHTGPRLTQYTDDFEAYRIKS